MKILPSDFGIDILQERVEKTNFPWLISNVIDNETGQPLADGKVSHIVDWCGRKIGLVSITYFYSSEYGGLPATNILTQLTPS